MRHGPRCPILGQRGVQLVKAYRCRLEQGVAAQISQPIRRVVEGPINVICASRSESLVTKEICNLPKAGFSDNLFPRPAPHIIRSYQALAEIKV
jgi:hypothetical protein